MDNTQPEQPNNIQKIELNPKVGGFLWSYIIFSIPGFIASIIWLIITLIIVVLIVISLFVSGSSQDNNSLKLKNIHSSSNSAGVLVYDLKGEISTTTTGLSSLDRTSGIYTDLVAKDFEQIKNNPNIKNVVFRLDTPGGEIYASEILGDLIADLVQSKGQSQAVFYFDELAASGGLWATYKNTNNYVVGSKYGETGSIGVIVTLPNYTGIADKIGYSEDVIKSAPNKDIGSPLRDVTPDEQAYFQNQVDTKYDQFLDIVSAGRNIPKDKVKTFATGLTYDNTEAKTMGLLDDVNDVNAAIDKAAQNANLGSNYNVWEVQNDPGFLQSLAGASGLSNLFGLPNAASQIANRVTALEPGKTYSIDENRI
jgi:protease-4